MTQVTTRIETREQMVERKAQEFYQRRGYYPYPLVLRALAAQVNFTAGSAF